MKMGIPITIDDTNMTTDAVVDAYDEWGADYSISTVNTAPSSIKKIIYNPINGDFWALDSNQLELYHRSSSAPIYTLAYTAPDSIWDITINPYTNRVFLVGRNASGDNCFFEVSTTDYSVTERKNIEITYSYDNIVIDMDTTDNVIFFASNSITQVLKYNISANSTVNIGSVTGGGILDIAVDPSTTDLYFIANSGANIEKISGGSGNSTTVATSLSLTGLKYDPVQGELVVWNTTTASREASGSLTTIFTSTGIGNVWIDWGSLSYIFSSGTISIAAYSARNFSSGAYVVYNDRVYVALADSYNINPYTDDETTWFDYGTTNPYRMFDGSLSSPTTATGEINIALENDNVTELVFFGMVAYSIQARLVVDTVEVFNETKILIDPGGVGDWSEYFFTPIEQINDIAFTNIPAYSGGDFEIVISGASPSDEIEAGLMVCGYGYDVGDLLDGVSPGYTNYSTTEIDAFGRISITERKSVKRLSGQCKVETREKASTVMSLYNRTKDLKVFWIASDSLETWALIYGICKRFDPVLNSNQGTYNFEILGAV